MGEEERSGKSGTLTHPFLALRDELVEGGVRQLLVEAIRDGGVSNITTAADSKTHTLTFRAAKGWTDRVKEALAADSELEYSMENMNSYASFSLSMPLLQRSEDVLLLVVHVISE